MAEELKPCPFCGGEPNLTHSDYVHDDLRPMPVVECKSCSAWVRAEDWNTRAQLPSQWGEAVEVVAYIDGGGGAIYTAKLLEIMSVEPDGCEQLMTVAQHQRILAAGVGIAEPVAMKTHGAWDGLDDLANLPDGTKLYTHPADQVEDDLTMVKVSRELLEQIAVELEHDNDRYFLGRELRALLNGGRV